MLRRLLGAFRGKPRSSGPGFLAYIGDVDAPLRVGAAPPLYAAQASVRLRTLIPAQRIARSLPVWILPPAAAMRPGGLEALGTALAVVIVKVPAARLAAEWPAFEPLLRWIESKSRAQPLVADLSDDYQAYGALEAGAPGAAAHPAAWQASLARHCHLTVPCEALRQALAPRAARGISVIEDPYESPRARPWRAPRAAPLRLCWFGNIGASTLPVLEEALHAVAARFCGAAIVAEIVAAAQRKPLILDMARRLGARHPGLAIGFTEWSPRATWEALERCDFVLLPQEAGQAWGRVKSHNRLVEALRAGRFALGAPIPSYLELAEFAWIGEEPAAGIEWALAHPREAGERVARGQAYVEGRFAPEVVTAKWRQALGLGAAQSVRSSAAT